MSEYDDTTDSLVFKTYGCWVHCAHGYMSVLFLCDVHPLLSGGGVCFAHTQIVYDIRALQLGIISIQRKDCNYSRLCP